MWVQTDTISLNMLLNIKVLLLTKVLLSYFKIPAAQLVLHGNKLAVHLHCFATM